MNSLLYVDIDQGMYLRIIENEKLNEKKKQQRGFSYT